jgi:glycosyltransferase involved in cell wall biosynthesis
MTRRIKVCLLVDTVGRHAGTERQVIETAKRLNKNVFDVHTCCLEPSAQLDALNEHGHIAVFPAASFLTSQGLGQTLRLRRYLADNDIDIVHAFMNRTAIFGVMSSWLAKRIVITSRLNTGYWYTPAQKALFRALNIGTTRVMANSEEAKRIAVEAEKVPAAKVDVVYQGVDMELFTAARGDASAAGRLGVPANATVVGIVANLRPVKDLPLFLRAAGVVASSVKDAAFLVVGSGEQLPELERVATDAGIRDRVFFSRGQGRVIDYLARMSIGCLTSLSEGFSNAILEYMAVGLPAVVTDVGGNREAVVDGETGYLVRERTPEAFAAPLLHLLRDEDLRRRMGQQGLSRCVQHFELGHTIIQLEKYYLSLMGGRADG